MMICVKLQVAMRKMASMAVKNVKDGYVIGLGSGSTVAEFVRRLASFVKEKDIEVRIVPSSLQIQIVAEESGLRVEEPSMISRIDINFDSADQVDKNYNLIKGGGGALFRERILMAAARRTIILVDENKFTKKLNRLVPIEVSPFARNFVADKLKCLGGNPLPRLNDKGYPQLTENSNLIFDTDFKIIQEPSKLAKSIRSIAGIIDVGIFTEGFQIIYKARRDGNVIKLQVT